MSEGVDFHRPFDTRRLGNEPFRETVTASEAERIVVATSVRILGLEKFEAEVRIEGWSTSGAIVEGRLRAVAVQACVVTLEPVRQTIDEPFRLTFLPAGARSADPRNVAEAEVIVHFDEDDPPDDLDGPILDIGPLLVEQLALALDPYPRAEGVTIEDRLAGEGEPKASPFAALARLRDE